MNEPQPTKNEEKHEDDGWMYTKMLRWNMLKCLLINEMDRQQIHHKYRDTD